MHRPLRIFGAVLLGSVLLGQTAVAQEERAVQGGRRVPAWIALTSDPIPGGEPFVVLRGVGPAREDILLLSQSADASHLSNAVRTLLTSRSAQGDTATQPGTFRMRGQQGRAAEPANLPWAERVVSDVRRVPLRMFPGVGRVRAIRIWLPAVGRARGRPAS
jgi:hypothetical protein